MLLYFMFLTGPTDVARNPFADPSASASGTSYAVRLPHPPADRVVRRLPGGENRTDISQNKRQQPRAHTADHACPHTTFLRLRRRALRGSTG